MRRGIRVHCPEDVASAPAVAEASAVAEALAVADEPALGRPLGKAEAGSRTASICVDWFRFK